MAADKGILPDRMIAALTAAGGILPAYGYAPDQIPPRLRTAHARYLAAEAELEQLCSQKNIPFAAI